MTLTRAACCAAVLSLSISFGAAAQCPPAFDAPPSYAFGELAELADFNHDGHLDALTLSGDENAFRLNLGHRGTFRRGAKLVLPGTPRGSAAGDFNHDGNLDVMLGGKYSGAIYFLPGRGDGTFLAARAVATASDPGALHAADLDADGKLDLVIANLGGDIDVQWGRGDGTFDATPLTFTPAFYPSYLATGDMNEDGRLDVIAGHENGAVTITTIGPNRTNDTPLRLNAAGFVYGLKVRDLDGDGHLDVIAADPIEFAVGFFKGKGDGTFAQRVDIPAGGFTEGVDFGDFNGDGLTDIVVGQSVEQSLAILYAHVDGTFSEPVQHLAGNNVYDVRVADLDHDGDDDIVASNFGGFVVLLQQFGRGEFPQAESLSVGGRLGPYDVIAADLNGDAIPDLVTANALHSTLSVLLGNPNGTMQEAAVLFADEGAYRVIAAHLNGDQHLDLVSANLFANTISVLHGLGDGTFHPAAAYDTSLEPSALSSGDIDRDGDDDLLVSSPLDGRIDVFLNAGNGTFTRGTDIESPRAPGQTLLIDLNGDQKLDLALVDREDAVEGADGHLTIHHGNGDGTFGGGSDYPVGVRPIDLATHDFNSDGQLDFAVANFDFGTVTILLREANGYRTVNDVPFNGPVPHFVLADFNLDGLADLAAPNGGVVYIHPGRGNGLFAEPITHRAGNVPFAITTADFNRDHRPDLATANTASHDVTILRNITSCRQRTVRK